MSKLLTISVAAYNVERTLDDTLRSLNDPRFLQDIEVLIIDDGSTDGTAAIAKQYEAMAPDTFHYIAKENGGHGSTINKSMELATGKYFRVIDGDDWVDTDLFATFIEHIKTTDADMITNAYREYRNGAEKTVRYITGLEEGRIYTWDEAKGVDGIWLATSTIKTSLLRENHVHITENCYYVDLEYVFWCNYLAGNVQYWDLPLYLYRISVGAQSTSKKNMLRNIRMMEIVSRKLANLYDDACRDGKLTGMHHAMVLRPVAQSIAALYRIYLLRDDGRSRIADFDSEISTISPRLHAELGKQWFVRAIRWGNGAIVPLASRLYRAYLRRKGRL